MNDENEGREKLHESIIEENKLYPKKFHALNFLTNEIPISKKGEHITINIVQLAKKNLEKAKRIAFRKKTKKIILSNNFLSENINSEKLNSRNEKNYNFSSHNFFTHNDKTYDDFEKRVLEKINKEKQRNLNDIKIINKKLPNNNINYFDLLMKEKKRNKKLILSNTYHDLKKISKVYKLIDSKNDNKIHFFKLPSIEKEKKNEFKSNLHTTRNITGFNKTINKTKIVNLYEQVLNRTLMLNQNDYFYYPKTERRYNQINISNVIPFQILRNQE